MMDDPVQHDNLNALCSPLHEEEVFLPDFNEENGAEDVKDPLAFEETCTKTDVKVKIKQEILLPDYIEANGAENVKDPLAVEETCTKTDVMVKIKQETDLNYFSEESSTENQVEPMKLENDPFEVLQTNIMTNVKAELEEEATFSYIDKIPSKNLITYCEKCKNMNDNDVNRLCNCCDVNSKCETLEETTSSFNDASQSTAYRDNEIDEMSDCKTKKHILSENNKKSTSDSLKLKQFSCAFCEEEFDIANELQYHMLFNHNNSKALYICKFCKKSFGRMCEYATHLRLHTGEKPFICGVCKKSFSRSHTLQMHIRSHTGERPFSCDLCEKTFMTSQRLKFHVLAHTGEKPYTCSTCNKLFATTVGLKLHENTHTQEKVYRCEDCNKVFKYPSGYKQHLKRSHK